MLIPLTNDQMNRFRGWFDLLRADSSTQVMIDDQTHEHTVLNADVAMRRIPPSGRLPVKFHAVGGAFIVNRMGLMSLEGAPKKVGAGFYASSNLLHNLLHAPDHVPGIFAIGHNPLESLEGWPAQGVQRAHLTYQPGLPLLRSLNTTDQIRVLDYPPPQINLILNKYNNQGKAGALKAAAELIRAGFKENARW